MRRRDLDFDEGTVLAIPVELGGTSGDGLEACGMQTELQTDVVPGLSMRRAPLPCAVEKRPWEGGTDTHRDPRGYQRWCHSSSLCDGLQLIP